MIVFKGNRIKVVKLTEEQYDERDSIMNKFVPERYMGYGWSGGIKHYENLDYDTLKYLIEKGYANKDDCQNSCPSIGTIFEVMERNPGLTAHGYFVERERDDDRISIEGVDGPCSKEDAKIFEDADDYIYDYEDGELYCWYD